MEMGQTLLLLLFLLSLIIDVGTEGIGGTCPHIFAKVPLLANEGAPECTCPPLFECFLRPCL